MVKGLCLTLLLVCYLPQSLASDLNTIYLQALQSDPTFQAAQASLAATQENLVQSEASILPSLAISANSFTNRNNISPFNQAPSQQFTNNSHGYTLSLNQTLFNYANWLQIRQASLTVKQAYADYQTAAQALILRVAKAYFNVLLSEDNLNLIKTKQQANLQQLKQAKARYQVGLETLTSVSETQAAYDVSSAQRITAENDLANNKEVLQTLTGEYPEQLASIKQPLPLLTPEPKDCETWVAKAQANNWQLQSLRYAKDTARETIKIKHANYLPTVNAIGSYQNTNGTYLLNPQSNLQTTSIGVQLDLPIYNGGLTASQARQAQYNYQKMSDDFEQTYRSITANTRQTFNSIIAGISKIKADQIAIKSNQNALDNTLVALKVGTRTMLDVLNAEQALYAAQTQYAQDEYIYLLDTLTLKSLSGTLHQNDLALLNTWLQPAIHGNPN